MTTIAQIKAARALLNWSQEDLAKLSGISKNAINNLERGIANPRAQTLSAIEKTLESAGVEFTDGPGVKMRGSLLKTEIFEGKDSIFRLFNDVIETFKHTGGELLASGINEPEKLRAEEKHFQDFMHKCTRYRIKSRVLVKEGDRFFVDAMKHYRSIPAAVYDMVPYFVYGSKYAILLWNEPARVIIIDNKIVADAYREQFMRLWENAPVQRPKEKERDHMTALSSLIYVNS